MTPTDYMEKALPTVLDLYFEKCICNNAGIRKIMSFNHNHYGAAPVCCGDTEILVHQLIRKSKVAYRKTTLKNGLAIYACNICGEELHEWYEEYSIALQCSAIEYSKKGMIAGKILTGYQGFDARDFEKINDFTRTEDIDEYMKYLMGTIK